MPKNPNDIKLSILMLSIPNRLEKYQKLQNKLLEQIGDRQDVEVICLVDNKSLHIYEKRNELMRIARGSHITFLDDDDDVADNYIEKITGVIEKDPSWDVISFNQHCDLDGKTCKVFCEMGNPHEPVIPLDDKTYHDCLRPPYHWCVWRKELAASEEFVANYHPQTGQSCEDIDWLMRLYPKVSRSYKLDDFLHIYQWSPSTTESILK